jgi:hypothetical protein
MTCWRQHHFLVFPIDHGFFLLKMKGFRLNIMQTDKTQIEKTKKMIDIDAYVKVYSEDTRR